MKRYPDIHEELKYIDEGYTVIGIDEVGKGCLAGPVCAAAVCLGERPQILKSFLRVSPRITDSKAMTPKARGAVYPKLAESACAYAIAYSSAAYINAYGIVRATVNAMESAVAAVLEKLSGGKIILLVDGLPIPRLDTIPRCVHRSYVKGDSRVLSIAAASVLAKVDRDNTMLGLHKSFGNYGWNENKGYGTASHREAIRQYGITEEHRTLFVRKTVGAL